MNCSASIVDQTLSQNKDLTAGFGWVKNSMIWSTHGTSLLTTIRFLSGVRATRNQEYP